MTSGLHQIISTDIHHFYTSGHADSVCTRLKHTGLAIVMCGALIACSADATTAPAPMNTPATGDILTPVPAEVTTRKEIQPTAGISAPSTTLTPVISTEPVVSLVTGDLPVNVREGPGKAYGVVGTLAPGESASITGRSQDGQWWRVDYKHQPGWMYVAVAPIHGDVNAVPVIAALAHEPLSTLTATGLPTSVVPASESPACGTLAACVRQRDGAICKDHTITNVTGSDACLQHGGVTAWLMRVCH